MQVENADQDPTRFTEALNTAQVLRKWCTPDTILAVTSVLDEDPLLFHIVKQARIGATKVILVHVEDQHTAPYLLESAKRRPEGNSRSEFGMQVALTRMARKLSWVGLNCEPILESLTSAEIPALVGVHKIDRILITGAGGQDIADPSLRSIVWRIMQKSEVPVCVVGAQACMNLPATRHFGRVSLALSRQSNCELALAFASRFAQEHHSRLNIVHVLDKQRIDDPTDQPELASCFPAGTLREAELFCPLDLTIRMGDPAEEILTSTLSDDSDFVILRSAGFTQLQQAVYETVSQKIIREARCPVIIMGSAREEHARERVRVKVKREPALDANESSLASNSVEEKECA